VVAEADLHVKALAHFGMLERMRKLREEAGELVEALDSVLAKGLASESVAHAVQELADVVTVGRSIVAHPSAKPIFDSKCMAGEAKLATILSQGGALS